MLVGFYQFEIKNGDRPYNLNKVHATLTDNAFDLVVLPELFSSGYLFSSREEAMEHSEAIPSGETTKALEKIAREKRAYIVGGILERGEDNKLYNSAVLIGPGGYAGKYRKIHLSTLETGIFEKGSDLCLFDVGGYKIGILICFDLWFPEASRTLLLSGADLICCPSNFGGQWSISFAKIRALENLLYYVTCNRTGSEAKNGITADFCGESQILNYDGQALAHAGSNEEIQIFDLTIKNKDEKDFVLAKDIYRDMNLYQSNYKCIQTK